MLSSVLAYGYLFIVGFIFLIMIVQLLAFYIAGRATDSINDEISSAFTLLGTMLVIGTASTLINAGISIFLEGMLIPALAASILYIIAIIYAVVKIYELSIGKSILFLLLSIIITAVLLGVAVYGGMKLIPGGKTKISMPETMGETTKAETKTEETSGTLMGEDPTEEITKTEAKKPSSPKMPAKTEVLSADELCSETQPCSEADQLCLGGLCYSEMEIGSSFMSDTTGCASLTCENCEKGSLDNLSVILNSGNVLDICIECNDETELICTEGYSCLGYKCVPISL